MKKIKNKVILITGAGKGMGRLLAEKLAGRGAVIAANDISPVNVEDTVKVINAGGGSAKAYVEDVAKKVGAQALLKEVEDDFGAIDVLINHAAVKPRASLLDMDEWDWHRTLDVNLTGAFLMIQSVGRIMREQGGGVIISLVPGAGERSEEEAGSYLASKAGLVELSRQADRELRPYGIRVIAVESSGDVAKNVLSILEEQ